MDPPAKLSNEVEKCTIPVKAPAVWTSPRPVSTRATWGGQGRRICDHITFTTSRGSLPECQAAAGSVERPSHVPTRIDGINSRHFPKPGPARQMREEVGAANWRESAESRAAASSVGPALQGTPEPACRIVTRAEAGSRASPERQCRVLSRAEVRSQAGTVTVQPGQRPRSPIVLAAALDATAGARRPLVVPPRGSSVKGEAEGPSATRASIERTEVARAETSAAKADPLPPSRQSLSGYQTPSGWQSPSHGGADSNAPLCGSVVVSSVSLQQPPVQVIETVSVPSTPLLIQRLRADSVGIRQRMTCDGNMRRHSSEADLDLHSARGSEKANSVIAWVGKEEAAREREVMELRAEQARQVWKEEAAWEREVTELRAEQARQVRELREDQARQAHLLAAAESRLGEEIGTLKEALAAEAPRCEQMESRLQKSFTGLVEEEAAVRRAVESHLEARLITMRSEVMTAVRAELEAYAKEFALARAAVGKTAKRAEAASAGQAAAKDSEEEVFEEQNERREGRRSRSPKKRLMAMQPLQEQPDKEHLARLDEAVAGFEKAIEREMKSRTELEQRLEGQLQAISAQVQVAMTMSQNVCINLCKEELKMRGLQAKDQEPLMNSEKMEKATSRCTTPRLSRSRSATPEGVAAQPEATGALSSRKQTGDEILHKLTASSEEVPRSSAANLNCSLNSVFSAKS